MEEMTTGYAVADPTLLKNLKPGDFVEFDADRAKGHYAVTTIRKVR
ncbi:MULTISPECIES: copper-binding protein [unclassified Methylobacterium]|jgi:Cu/Ag efflux protein CusF|nr:MULTISPECIES: copper-binding protein [unclassified Methylobacterium]